MDIRRTQKNKNKKFCYVVSNNLPNLSPLQYNYLFFSHLPSTASILLVTRVNTITLC